MTDDPNPPITTLQRFPTGLAGLDQILQGGLFRGDTYMIMGEPGTGKTTLANQICFVHAASGKRAVYITLLAEEHSRLLAHFEGFAFYDPTLVGDGIAYYSAYDLLNREGLSGLLTLLRRVVREQKASLIVIDGMATAQSIAKSDLDIKEFIAGLQVACGVLGCTVLLLTSQVAETYQPEYTMVDGLLHLQYQIPDLRAVRTLSVRKFRGSPFLEGRHNIAITDEGVTVYPRTEVLFTTPPPVSLPSTIRLGFGIEGLDAMLHGGVYQGSMTALVGSAGSGKTSFGLHFLAEGAQRGDPTLHIGFYESPEQLIAQATSLGLDFATFVDQGLVEIIWQPATEANIDALADLLLTNVRQRGVRRLFIDGLGGFQIVAAHTDRLSAFMTALHRELYALNVTTLMTIETSHIFGPQMDVPLAGLSAIVDNLIFTRVVELHSHLHRFLSIFKVRRSGYDPAIREFVITSRGIELAGTAGSADALLTGTARSRYPVTGEEHLGSSPVVSNDE